MRWAPWTPLTLVLWFGAVAPAAEKTSPSMEFSAQIQRLDPKHDRATRLKALEWLIAHHAAKDAGLAIPVLERIIRKDTDERVREDAVVALQRVAKKLRKPCPLVLLEAILDEDVMVRQAAG